MPMAVKFQGSSHAHASRLRSTNSRSEIETIHAVLGNERGGSSWDLVLKVLSITLVSLFAFSSGIWFGKKLSDSDYQRQALEGEFDREVQKSSDSRATNKSQDDDDVLTDEEVAAATEKAMEASRKTASADSAEAKSPLVTNPATEPTLTKGHTTAMHPTAHSSAPITHANTTAGAPANVAASKSATKDAAERSVASMSQAAVTKPDLSAVHQAATRVANNAAPTNPAIEQAKSETRVPSSLPKTVGASADVEFTVQIASYPTAEAAKEHVEAMVKKGFPAFPVEAKINGKTWYRVSVGSFKTFNDASKFRAQLLKQADLPSAIVQKIAR